MRLPLFALLLVGLALALFFLLRRPAPAPVIVSQVHDEPRTIVTPPSLPSLPRPAPATVNATANPTANVNGTTEVARAANENNDAAVAEWHAHREERDYAYWDMKLNMLRKIQTCVGDKMSTLGAAEVTFHFKKQDDVWLADSAELRDPSDEERDSMGATEFRGADRELAQKCIGDAFAGSTMPMVGMTDQYEQYEVRGQIMFPTANDKAWKQTGVNP